MRSDLREAGKADHQHVGAGALEILFDLLGRFILLVHQTPGEHGRNRGQCHGERDDRDQQRGGRLRKDPGRSGSGKEDETEFAALRQKQADADGVVMP